MRLLVVAVGQRVPDWAQTAWDDYAKRFPPEMRLELKAVKTEPRGSKTTETLWAAERQRIEAAIPRGCRVVALDDHRDRTDRDALLAALHATGGNVSACAQRLRISRMTVYRLCRKHGIAPDTLR